MAIKENQSSKRYYPLRDVSNPYKVTLVEITEEQYRALYPEIWATQKREQYHHRCMCPKKYIWKCDAKGNGRSVPALSAIKTPLRDGDMERPDDAAYANSYFVNANATSAPGIVDADCNPILTRSEVYSGVYGRASISFYAFNSSGNKGIACGLNNLQKLRDGEPLGGKASAESDFASDEDDDFLN